MKRSEFTEVDVARPVVEWLQGCGWDVYQEVKTGDSGKVADIVAVQGNIVWVVEVKTSLSLAVMEQADEWRYRTHYVSIATLGARIRRRVFQNSLPTGRRFARRVLEDRGIGLIELHEKETWDRDERKKKVILELSQTLEPKLMRKAYTKPLRDCLNEAQKTMCEAGTQRGHRWSPYRETIENLKTYLARHPGNRCLLKTAIANVRHHYHSDKTAFGSLSHWIFSGKLKEFRIEKRERHSVLVLVKEEQDGKAGV